MSAAFILLFIIGYVYVERMCYPKPPEDMGRSLTKAERTDLTVNLAAKGYSVVDKSPECLIMKRGKKVVNLKTVQDAYKATFPSFFWSRLGAFILLGYLINIFIPSESEKIASSPESKSSMHSTQEIAKEHYFLKKSDFLYSVPSEKGQKIIAANSSSSGPVEVGTADPLTVYKQQGGWSFVRMERENMAEIHFDGWVPDKLLINRQQKERNEILAMGVREFARDYGRAAGEAINCAQGSEVAGFSTKVRQAILTFKAYPAEETGAIQDFNVFIDMAGALNALGKKGVDCNAVKGGLAWRMKKLEQAGF